MSNKAKRMVKCEGRFHELRSFLYDEVFPTVIGEETTIGKKDLEGAWELLEDERFRFDQKDPYFHLPHNDVLRKAPLHNYLSLVPLIEGPTYHLDRELIKDYALSMGNNERIAKLLSLMEESGDRFFRGTLDKEPKGIVFPDGTNLSKYLIDAGFGIGTLVKGGVTGGGTRSDSPFLLNVYQPKSKGGEFDLVAVVGFWAQEDNMLVSQMQSNKNGRFPGEVPFGVGCLQVAEAVARPMGFNKLILYSARGHPVFKEHPDSWKQYGASFVAEWDGSAKKLGYDGSRNQHYEKNLK